FFEAVNQLNRWATLAEKCLCDDGDAQVGQSSTSATGLSTHELVQQEHEDGSISKRHHHVLGAENNPPQQTVAQQHTRTPGNNNKPCISGHRKKLGRIRIIAVDLYEEEPYPAGLAEMCYTRGHADAYLTRDACRGRFESVGNRVHYQQNSWKRCWDHATEYIKSQYYETHSAKEDKVEGSTIMQKQSYGTFFDNYYNFVMKLRPDTYFFPRVFRLRREQRTPRLLLSTTPRESAIRNWLEPLPVESLGSVVEGSMNPRKTDSSFLATLDFTKATHSKEEESYLHSPEKTLLHRLLTLMGDIDIEGLADDDSLDKGSTSSPGPAYSVSPSSRPAFYQFLANELLPSLFS
ncbi:unnamed protein product, partial [Amoebophrya sp. A25]